MHYLVIKELPQGQQPGATVDLPEEVGAIFEGVGAVRKVLTGDPDETERPRRRYQRRDLAAIEG